MFWQTASGEGTSSSPALVFGPRVEVRLEVAEPFFVSLEGEALGAAMQIGHQPGVVFLPGGTSRRGSGSDAGRSAVWLAGVGGCPRRNR